jgi:hypothetical protein
MLKSTWAGQKTGSRHTLHEPDIFVKKHAAKKENSFHLLVKDVQTFRITFGIFILCSVQTSRTTGS